MCRQAAGDHPIVFRQSNREYEIIDWVHEAIDQGSGIIINPAAFTFTSMAIMDALKMFPGPIVELHISNIHRREPIYHKSYVSPVATAVIAGLGTNGYPVAVRCRARHDREGVRKGVRSMTSGRPPAANSDDDDAGRLSSLPSVLVGLVGAGIQASRTPGLHEREGAEQGLRYVYKLIDLEALGLDASALPDILTAAQRFGFAGLNITHPCKQAVIPLLDDLSPDAAALGAVNTVVLKDGRRIGHNTDWWGFAESFRRELPDVRRERVVQFGAGGAGAAVAHALLTLGAGEVILIDTDQARAGDPRRRPAGAVRG